MATNKYRFLTHWQFEAPPPVVFDVITEVKEYPRWWPKVWLAVEQLEPDGPDGVGSVYKLHSRGWLPYTLHWTSRTVEKVRAERLRLVASGDFVGEGLWTFQPDGTGSKIEYLWEIVAEKPLLKWFSFALKPFFRANHNWAMRQGEQCLANELERLKLSAHPN